MGYLKTVGFLTVLMFIAGIVVAAEERDPIPPRVPEDQRAEAKGMKNPVEATPKNVAKGKALFAGKGTCINCHGKEGKGDGPAGAVLPIGPRNFTNCKFHKKRKDGELFWVIKNGSPETPMVSMVPNTITEEEAWTVLLYERSFCKKKGGDEE